MTTNPTDPVAFRRGKKVILRPIEESDLLRITRWINDDSVTRYLAQLYPKSAEDERRWLENLRENRSKQVILAIQVIGGPHIGTVGLHGIHPVHRHATSGIMIGESSHWSQGYGTDAAMLMLHYAFCTLNLRRVTTHVISFNSRSEAHKKKCGFREEGRLRSNWFRDGQYHDEILLGALRDEWLPNWEEYNADAS